MAFYIKPPKGTISRRKLQKYAEKRFRFLSDLMNCKGDREKLIELLKQISTVDGSECLITGSQCDRISHFIVRLALCNNPRRAEWFIKAEVTLFKIRLDVQNAFEKEQCLQEAQHQITKFSSFQPYSYRQILTTLKSICNFMKVNKNGNAIKVPFEHALKFVRNRELPLKNGQVIVPLKKITELLLSLHELILHEGIQQMKNSGCAINASSDSRVKDITHQLQNHFDCKFQSFNSPGIILANNMDNTSKHFPPCMLHLYRILKHRHRLQHKARIQLTLFLKDIGMPLSEALSFWENEYSKPTSCNSACSHSWVKEKHRYIYNIRHLYGQEGSRQNYRSQSCSTLQNGFVGVCYEGGCPFSQFDIENIEKMILTDNVKGQHGSEITNCIQQRKYKEACLHYLLAQFLNEKNGINSPILYNSICFEVNKCNVSNRVICYENMNVDHTVDEFPEYHNIALSNPNINYSDSSKKFANLQQSSLKDEYYLSEILNSYKVHRKVMNPNVFIHNPVDYFKSFQVLLEGIKD